MRHRALVFCSGVALSALALAPEACAAGAQAENGQASVLNEVVVTGTRASGRTALTSTSPIDVVSSKEILQTGYPDLARALEVAEPTLNFPRAQTTPSSANTRPVTLRGLSPDEVLVLVDGKRWHSSAVINTNFAVGRGTAPVDLAAIPEIAIDRVEVLKDGAAAQYGSDAIAGVVNIILKKNDAGGLYTVQGGVTEKGDGANGQVAFSQGLSFGQGGQLTVSGDVLGQGATDRSGVDQRYGRRTFRLGDPDALQADVAATTSYPVAAVGGEAYGELIVARKDSSNAVQFIAPGASPLYPNGFLPKVEPVIWDIGETVGLRGGLGGSLKYDLSNSFGVSDADFHVNDSANLALGAASPTRFYAGNETYIQDVTDLTFNRAFPNLLSGANLAFGGQFRFEHYGMGRGDAASITGAGASGFPGLNPYDPVDASREAGAGFVDGELKPAPWLTLAAAGRYDHYSDFGGAATGKGSIRVQAAPWLALRGSYSTGFRAPSLQQEDYNSVTVVANGANKSLVNLGNFEVGDPIARALGAKPLRPESSHDLTAGFVFTPIHNLAITADVFRTDIENRIALSNTLSGSTVTSVLAAAGITNVQQVGFFTNALGTRTTGFDLDGDYRGRIGPNTAYHLALGYESSPTAVRGVAPDEAVPSLKLQSTHSILLLADAQPQNKLTGSATLDHGSLSGGVDVTRYGHYVDAPISAPQLFSAKTLVNLTLTKRFSPAVSLTAGVLNVGDVYPDRLNQIALAYSTFGNAFYWGEESPFGVDGRSYYLRVTFRR